MYSCTTVCIQYIVYMYCVKARVSILVSDIFLYISDVLIVQEWSLLINTMYTYHAMFLCIQLCGCIHMI